eukprot:Colp12_sorted_trinity150504_noHs@6054
MGGVLGSLACCFTSSAASLCCRCCPSCKSSTASRAMYCVVFFLMSLSAWILRTDWASAQLAKVPQIATDWLREHCLIEDGCNLEALSGIIGVYRMCFAGALFFAFFMVFMFGVSSSMDCRAGLQNGFWGPKLLLLIGVIVGCFFIPNSFFTDAYSGIALTGTVIFLLCNLILLVDAAHGWSESWVEKYEESESKGWFFLLIGSSVVLFSSVIVLTVLMYVYYTTLHECALNKFFISFNLCLVILASVVAILPKVQEANPRSGILQSGVVSLYCTYLVWSAVSSEPDDYCSESELGGSSNTLTQVLGTFFTFVAVIQSSFFMGSRSSSYEDDSGSGRALLSKAELGEDAGEVEDDEKSGVAYSYSLFHLVFVAASLYMSMLICDFATLSSLSTQPQSLQAGKGWGSVWVKIASSWVAMLLYMWSLVAPIVLPDRDFS